MRAGGRAMAPGRDRVRAEEDRHYRWRPASATLLPAARVATEGPVMVHAVAEVGDPARQGAAEGAATTPAAPVGPDAPVMEIMRTTRAMRHLASDQVPRELLLTVIEAATWAPSGGNWQPVRYLVVTDRAKMAELAPLWGRAIDDFRLAIGSAGASEGSDASRKRTAASIDYQREHFAEIPALIVICEDRGAYGMTRGALATLWRMARAGGWRRALRIARAQPRFRRGEAASIYPAVENLLLAARAHGLAACFTSWHLFAEDDFKRVLGLPRDVRTWGIVPVGHPLKAFGPVNRRPVDEAIRWERW